MKHISILVLKNATLTSIDAARQLFTKVNEFLKYQGAQPVFTVELVALTKKITINEGLYTIQADKILQDVKNTSLIIIPQVCGNYQDVLQLNKGYVPWIQQQHRRGSEVASLCVGAFFLASTGLLNGRKCATHWSSANEFRVMFPDVDVVSDKIITDEKGIYTSGGSFSYLNLILYLIEKYVSRDMAVLASKMFEIEIERMSQAPFVIFMGQREHNDALVKSAQEMIENDYHNKITIDQLTSALLTGRRNFERRFKKATSNTVTEYIQRVKIEAVKKGLETSKKNIIDLMYDVGYTDIKAFRALFKKITGLSPIAYRAKYQKDPA